MLKFLIEKLREGQAFWLDVWLRNDEGCYDDATVLKVDQVGIVVVTSPDMDNKKFTVAIPWSNISNITVKDE